MYLIQQAVASLSETGQYLRAVRALSERPDFAEFDESHY